MFTKREISRYGRILISENPDEREYSRANEALEQWRSAHRYPMECIEDAIIDASSGIDGALCASRLKRRDTILGKIARENSRYELRTLDDIAGCRCILPSIADVDDVACALMEHDGYHSEKNYIVNPKESGYRGRHLFFRVPSSEEYSYFGNLRVEVQLRTQVQHAWATAVEIYDIITESKHKFGQGGFDSSRELALIAHILSFGEGCPGVPGFPSTLRDAVSEFRKLDEKLRMVQTLAGFSESVNAISDMEDVSDVEYYILQYDYAEQLVIISTFQDGRSANEMYSKLEGCKPDESDVLLVKADSIEDLKAAYPNYFADLVNFLRLLSNIDQ